MKTEDDTFEALKKISFNQIVSNLSNYNNVSSEEMLRILIKGCREHDMSKWTLPESTQYLYGTWTLAEFYNECLKRSIYYEN